MPNQILNRIDGLTFVSRWKMDNDSTGELKSAVVPFPLLSPFNVVYHGENHFDYGHYGIHLGQEDRLTFLGHPEHLITGKFYDGRRTSRTRGAKVMCQFQASSARTLHIPAGVAHSFDGLEGVVTLNTYQLFLPHPAQFLQGSGLWNPAADIINVSEEQILEEGPAFDPNTEPVSYLYYRELANRIRQKRYGSRQYPEMQTIEAMDGKRWLRMYERDTSTNMSPAREPAAIDGVHWNRRSAVRTGKHSGIVPFADEKPFYIVDHDFRYYENDTYGVHLQQEDRLTFLGRSSQIFHVEMVDLRESSPQWGKKVAFDTAPSPFDELVIPQGVAHRFIGMQGIFTLNQPRYCFDTHEMLPGKDVLDWSESEGLQKLRPHRKAAPDSFYKTQVAKQTLLAQSGTSLFSPSGYLVEDGSGERKKAIFRKRV